MRILGIDTPDARIKQWAAWIAPERQPFFLTENEIPGITNGPHLYDVQLNPEIRDTYETWSVKRSLHLTWLDEPAFNGLPRETRAALVRAQHDHGRGEVPSVRAWRHVVPEAASQADGHRFVWWRSLLEGREQEVLADWIADGMRSSRHAEVPATVWRAAGELLPNARTLAGTWPETTGPNCFGTVMAATGVGGAHEVWMKREPFEEFLATRTTPGGNDDQPGTVLVWRSASDGLLQHAAVTLGGGYALQKRSQGWYSPREVLTVAETINASRARGQRLSRHLLVATS